MENMGDKGTGVECPHLYHYSGIAVAGMRDGGTEREQTSMEFHLPA